MTRTAPLVIAGGGLAGCLVALALAKRRPDINFLLLEESQSFGGNHVWSFFDTDIASNDRWVLEAIACRRWPDHEVRFPKRRRRIAIGYNSIRSADLDRAVRATLRPSQYRLGSCIARLQPTSVLLQEGEMIEASAVLDARGPAPAAGLDLCWQKFVGRTYAFRDPHEVERPIIMDATVPQEDGYRFVYSLPFSETELMVEDTYYSSSPKLDSTALGRGLDLSVSHAPGPAPALKADETGILPVVLGGRIEALWPASAPPVPRLGLRGGFFHPTTGYSLPDAVRNAALLARRSDHVAAGLHADFEALARKLWKERAFFRLLNRMLFKAAAPDQRYRVLEHFYRLPEPVIARFYAARLTSLDKLRILTGRPPVPVRRALAAMRTAAA